MWNESLKEIPGYDENDPLYFPEITEFEETEVHKKALIEKKFYEGYPDNLRSHFIESNNIGALDNYEGIMTVSYTHLTLPTTPYV